MGERHCVNIFGPEKKWPILCRHFQMHFVKRKVLYFDLNLTVICCWWSDNKSALVQLTAWRQRGDNLCTNQRRQSSLTPYGVTGPQGCYPFTRGLLFANKIYIRYTWICNHSSIFMWDVIIYPLIAVGKIGHRFLQYKHISSVGWAVISWNNHTLYFGATSQLVCKQVTAGDKNRNERTIFTAIYLFTVSCIENVRPSTTKSTKYQPATIQFEMSSWNAYPGIHFCMKSVY